MKVKDRILPITATIAILAGAIAAANAAPERNTANPLRVGLFPAGNGKVEVQVTNTSKKTARIPRWQLPEEILQQNLFRVSRDGKPLRYEGAMVKRAVPTASEFAILRPGQTWRNVVDLAATYDMSQRGDYTISLASPLQFASLSGGERLLSKRGSPMVLESAPLRVWHDATIKPFAHQLDANVQAAFECHPRKPLCPHRNTDPVKFVGCSASRVTELNQAIAAARNYSENSKGYLTAGTTGPRYTTWFGAYTSSRYATAQSQFAAIDVAMDQNNGQITINCGCSSSAYAYVYPGRHYQIFVCNAFWSAPMTGTDSKAGTLIHEMSHFNVVAGTDDHVYGQTGAKNLAISNPTAALNNADNHEYFAENTPSQN